ncbi:MAG TPA: MBOAT family O-acyltransferase [Candidatus Binatia bacterium]|nr:MBOAT family O-acyltransferase [Candidatus Binatia bacterium]
MISWTFACAAVLLALAAAFLPERVRTPAILLLSLAGVAAVWDVPIAALVAIALAVWGAGVALPRLPERVRSAALLASVAAIVAALVWLRSGHPARASLVPTSALVGVSYFSLKFIQHLVDAAAGRTPAIGPVPFLATIFFLPTYSAGPIERTAEFPRKLADGAMPWGERVLGVERILLGLAKKLLVGDPLLAYAEPVFREPWLADRGTLWLAMYAFALAVYLDFAGYSDIAIGTSRLAGIRVRENFDSPYLQPNLTMLWQRWHMSLTSWLRDFVFVPVARRALRATRRPLASQAAAQTATMVLCGLWHGVAWNFAAWGLYHAVLLTGLGVWRGRRAGRVAPAAPVTAAAPPAGGRGVVRLRDAASIAATFHSFALGLVLFGCPLGIALRYLARMFFADGLLPR